MPLKADGEFMDAAFRWRLFAAVGWRLLGTVAAAFVVGALSADVLLARGLPRDPRHGCLVGSPQLPCWSVFLPRLIPLPFLTPSATGPTPAPGAGRPSHSGKEKQVRHNDVLNKQSFWLGMGAFILCIGASVVRLELGTRHARSPTVEPAEVSREPTASGEGEVHSVQDVEAVKDAKKRRETFHRILNLTYCVVSLNASMLLWGISQEFVMTNNYGSERGVEAKVPSALFVVFCNRLSSSMFTGWVVWLHGQELRVPGCLIGGKAAFSNGVSSWSQYASLSYISFTLQTTAKSAKMLPVLLMSSFRGKSHSPVDYAETLSIVCALVVFGLETDGRESDGSSTVWKGVALLGILLFFDSCTPHLQDQLFSTHPEVSAVQATFAMSSFAAVGILVVQLLTGTAVTCAGFLMEYPGCLLHLGVLSLASTLTQYFISYTVKNFGPTVFTLIASTRQVIAVVISAALFSHRISSLASVSVALIFGMVVDRAVRSFVVTKKEKAGRSMLKLRQFVPLLVCGLGLHALHFSYGAAQEFLSTHRFHGQRFAFPEFTVAVNHLAAALVGLGSLRLRGLAVRSEDKPLKPTLLPGAAIFGATTCQHLALSFISFEAQTLMKTLKVIPVMLVGVLLKNRRYSVIDYVEGMVITALTMYFAGHSERHREVGDQRAWVGILLMLGYLALDSFTSNFQDHLYQKFSMDPAQVLVGMEVVSAAWAAFSFLVLGQLGDLLRFFSAHPGALLHVLLLALSAACGAYVCTITVRMFGPAVFTLLMVSRQVLSQVVSIWLFNHPASFMHMLCLVAVSMVTLTSSLRRVSTKLAVKAASEETNPPTDSQIFKRPSNGKEM